jgi:hypothetical protein
MSFWGPRALAVISCALALLAAQPVMGASHAAVSKPALLGEAGSSWTSHGSESKVRAAEAASRGARKQESFFASARRLHVLATVEIFQRLLMAELRAGGERQAVPLVYFAPAYVELLAPASAVPSRPRTTAPSFQALAQIFAITHCLLAPPAM